ncbi:MAG: YerC/YecD family TrpR-related protein [Peptoniphilaceae bacterium]
MKYNSKMKNDQTDGLFEAILKLETIEDCYRFFEDICTVKEIQAISQRLEVVKLLIKNKTYHQIEEETGASTATISRINRSLNYGSDGYKLVLDRLDFYKDIEESEKNK